MLVKAISIADYALLSTISFCPVPFSYQEFDDATLAYDDMGNQLCEHRKSRIDESYAQMSVVRCFEWRYSQRYYQSLGGEELGQTSCLDQHSADAAKRPSPDEMRIKIDSRVHESGYRRPGTSFRSTGE